ncbi:ABC transporter ATP-binding protein [Weissella confusa]|jgi:ABC-2 type transport system ATP-binding protein|uniref:ABC transporter ATP-binding protein n=1 Tax=Weissella confusa TaxID=1583 RepID=UPI000704B571|nr:ABC transporter ATP-binding protein [Weissella confusa]KRN23932.1 ABC transporter ATP binding protein [Weissella confusa]MBD1491662.1 ABC transporter ATP-binding protein [Weissella confusa]MBD5832252.1 ATP-binding cassette domain-containing protein [Weissella confusa]MBF7058695.1 ABC transporter ATP-binding protein [Weissella confusa]MBJ7622673.1 ABC transporter ATP-binding protein [Weissella confusa]
MIELKNLNKRFGDKLAVQDMNMVIKPGEVMGLIGQNGAGKTTTFRMVLDFIEPTSGEITWDGHKITSADKQRIGFLPEERGLYQKLTIEEQVMYFAELHGMKRADAKASLQDWMKRLDVVGKTTDKVQKLSKGNAQKVQLISTVIFHPEFLILDEPFTGLDPVNTELMMNEIKRLKQDGAMIIFSSHNMSGVEKLSDHLTMLRHGETVLSGATTEIRESFGRTEIYIESPVADADLLAIDGVLSVEPQGIGRQVRLTNAEVGRQVFSTVAQDGYVPVFAQTAPTLDEIFRREVQGGGVND